MKSVHVELSDILEAEYNCNVCSFQGYSENDLKKHQNVCKHRASNVEPSGKSLSCHSCGFKLNTKKALMVHRKETHPEIIKTCRFFLKEMCTFEDEDCWYRHERRQDVEDNLENIQCKICKQNFMSKFKR